MDVECDLIWGDDNESEVFAQAQSHGFCLIFRYSLNLKLPQSLQSRIVTCYHDLSAKDTSETFLNRASMRKALYSSLREIWDQCVLHPSVTAPDVTIEIYEDVERQYHWRISHESLYKQYLELLSPVDSFFRTEEATLRISNTVDYSCLARINF